MSARRLFAASLSVVLTLAVPVASGAAPQSAPPTDRQCFYARQVSGFSAPDRDHVYVRVGVRDVYAFDLLGGCPDVDWTLRLGIVSRGSNFICSGLDTEVVVPRGAFGSPFGPQRCPVAHMRKLTPEEVAALPRRSRP